MQTRLWKIEIAIRAASLLLAVLYSFYDYMLVQASGIQKSPGYLKVTWLLLTLARIVKSDRRPEGD
jgi:hypothetical protein